jgi:hypothetical protein
MADGRPLPGTDRTRDSLLDRLITSNWQTDGDGSCIWQDEVGAQLGTFDELPLPGDERRLDDGSESLLDVRAGLRQDASIDRAFAPGSFQSLELL